MSRRMIGMCLSVALLVLGSRAAAQSPSPRAASPAAVAVPAPAPLTDGEKKDLQLLSLKAQLTTALKEISDLKADAGTCQAQLGPLQFAQNRDALTAEQSAIKDAVEKARPGFLWDPMTGLFSKKPDAPTPPKGQ